MKNSVQSPLFDMNIHKK